MCWLNHLKYFLILGFLYRIAFIVDARMIKIQQDLQIDNIIFMQRLVIIFSVPEKSCAFHCDKLTNGESNFRRFNSLKHICECFRATEDFRDTRHVAPYTDVIVSFVNSKHQFSLVSIFKNYHLQKYCF